MLGLLEDRLGAIDERPRVDELVWIELVAAVVALIPARARKSADRAGPLDVPVGERTSRGFLERSHRGLLDEVALVVQRLEDVLDDDAMVVRRRPSKEVVREPERSQVFADDAAVLVDGFLRCKALGVGLDEVRSSVLVRAAHHEHVVAHKAVIAGEHIGRHAEAGDMPEMTRTVRVRPCHRDENALRHQ